MKRIVAFLLFMSISLLCVHAQKADTVACGLADKGWWFELLRYTGEHKRELSADVKSNVNERLDDVFRRNLKWKNMKHRVVIPFRLDSVGYAADRSVAIMLPAAVNGKAADFMLDTGAGINVVSAINIQHIESLNDEVKEIAGIEVKERVPDSVLQEADEVVNIDLTAEELIARLKSGKIYRPEKIQTALHHFFKTENILQLRELALKEVAFRVEKKVESEVLPVVSQPARRERILACISSNEHTPRHIIRKAYRLASRYSTSFTVLYVQTPRESTERISLASQRYLLNHFKLVTELGGDVLQVFSESITEAIIETCREKQITTICMGHPAFKMPQTIFQIGKYKKFLQALAEMKIDLIIIA